jgi:hypothetical protein
MGFILMELFRAKSTKSRRPKRKQLLCFPWIRPKRCGKMFRCIAIKVVYDCTSLHPMVHIQYGKSYFASGERWAVSFLEYWNFVWWNMPYDHGV